MLGKILKLHIEAYKGLKDIDINWEDEYNILALIADGGLGKSSIVDFVKSCLTADVNDYDINTVLEKAKGDMDISLGGKVYKIVLSKTKKSETLKLYSPDKTVGGKEAIRLLVGNVAISPFEVCKKDTGEQISFFKKVFKIDSAALETEYNVVYDERTLINRQINAINAYFLKEGINENFLKEKLAAYQEEKKLGELPDLLILAKKKNKERDIVITEQDTAERDLRFINSNINEYEDQIKLLQQKISTKILEREYQIKVINEKVMFLEENKPQDESAIQKQIDDINNYALEREKLSGFVMKVNELNDLTESSKNKTTSLKEKLKAIDDLIISLTPDLKDIKMYQPKKSETGEVLETREGIFWMDKPIGILSTTEKIAFGIELQKAINPNGLPLLLIDDFESVGSLARKEIIEMIKKEGYRAIVAEMDLNTPNLKVVLKNDFISSPEDKVLIDAEKKE